MKERAIWNEFLQPLQDKVRVSLIAKGIYPLLLFRCAELNKNRGRQFSSLMMFVVASLTNRIPTSEASLDKILFAGHVLQVDLSRKVLDDHSESLDCLLETYVTCVLFDSDNDDKQLVSN